MSGHPPCVLSGSCHPELARSLAAELGVSLADADVRRFADGEIDVRVPGAGRGRHAVIVQPTSPPAERHLLELGLLADACRRGGARRITAVIPYFGYARQDRRAHAGGAIGVRVVSDLIAAAHIDRIVSVDVHCAAIEAVSTALFDQLSALPPLLRALRAWPAASGVVVAPDLGAAKLAQNVGRTLGAPVALVHKSRGGRDQVEALDLLGEVRQRAPLIVDDMISTGATIDAAVSALLAAGCTPRITVAATHALFVGPAHERLARLPIERIAVTDSVPFAVPDSLPVERVSLAPLLATAIASVD
jgi:ribose-phosphate pyrophosphokinase